MDSVGDRKILKLALVSVVPASLIAAAAAYAMTSNPSDAADSETPFMEVSVPVVTVDQAAERAISQTAFAIGSLTSREDVLVGARVQIEGIWLDAVLVEVGDYVEKGQVMATLDRAVLLVRLDQQNAEIAKADAGIAQAKAEIVEAEASEREAALALLRATELAKGDIVSQEKLEQRKSAATVAIARLDAQRQNLEALKADKLLAEARRRETALNLARTEVTAPESGLVASRTAKVGQTATLGSEPLFRIIRDGDIELEAEIIDRDLSLLAIGQSAEATIAGFTDVVSGKIRLIDPIVDEKTRLAKIRLSLDRIPGLRLGLFAQVKIETETRRSVVIPRSALQTETGHGCSVKVVENGIVRIRKVVTGLSDRDGIEIVSGLRAGELVVARAAGFLRDGDRVNPRIASKTTAGRVTHLE
jgi:HlyD family secretion protein